jgi:hypothetical protein
MKTRLNTCKSKLNNLPLAKWHKHTKERSKIFFFFFYLTILQPDITGYRGRKKSTFKKIFFFTIYNYTKIGHEAIVEAELLEGRCGGVAGRLGSLAAAAASAAAAPARSAGDKGSYLLSSNCSKNNSVLYGYLYVRIPNSTQSFCSVCFCRTFRKYQYIIFAKDL